MKSNEFRILGAELGETNSFIDVTVSGIDVDGTIYFQDTDADREWPLENGEVRRLLNQNLMVESANVVQHKLWKVAETIEKKGQGNSTDDFAKDHVADAQRSAFLAAYFETR